MQIPIKRHAIPVFPERQRPHVKELNDLPFPRKRVSFEKKSLRFFYFRCVCVGGGGGDAIHWAPEDRKLLERNYLEQKLPIKRNVKKTRYTSCGSL